MVTDRSVATSNLTIRGRGSIALRLTKHRVHAEGVVLGGPIGGGPSPIKIMLPRRLIFYLKRMRLPTQIGR